MWLIFGILAIIFTFINIYMHFNKKESKIFMYLGLTFTTLTVMAFYQQNANWIVNKEWTALEDVVPTTNKYLWICTTISIILNGITMFDKKRK